MIGGSKTSIGTVVAVYYLYLLPVLVWGTILVADLVRSEELEGLGWDFLLVLCPAVNWLALLGLLFGSSEGYRAVGPLLCWVVVGVGITVVKALAERRAADETRRQAAEAAAEARRQRHKEEQQGYRNQMMALGEQSLVLFESVPNELRSAEGYLDQAEADFADRAFVPFWDCIENAARLLARIDERVRQIKGNSDRYSRLIQKYDNVPPSFPLAHESVTKLAVAGTSAERMQAIVRKAQRDFQFARIYVQCKTNQILVAGFTNLAQGLKDMTWQITASIDDLARSVDGMASTLDESLRAIHSRVGDIAETASRHADEASKAVSEAAARERRVLEMLDNIQRGRRPFP